MEWAEINIYTTTAGIDSVTGILMDLGITGFVIKDAQDFENFLENKTGNWDYIDDDLMGLKNCETTVTVYIRSDAEGAELFAAVTAGWSTICLISARKIGLITGSSISSLSPSAKSC